MEYPWYEIVRSDPSLMQGDLLPKCPIPLINESYYEAILGEHGDAAEPAALINPDVIILSQACDLAQGKVNSVVVCPVMPLEQLQLKKPDFATTHRTESLCQGREPALHLLNKFSADELSIGYIVVDFHHIFSLPKGYLSRVAASLSNRLRLLPPYREHLSQAFARYFMRVGLPVDIDKAELMPIGE
jgi:hypothetical protein